MRDYLNNLADVVNQMNGSPIASALHVVDQNEGYITFLPKNGNSVRVEMAIDDMQTEFLYIIHDYDGEKDDTLDLDDMDEAAIEILDQMLIKR